MLRFQGRALTCMTDCVEGLSGDAEILERSRLERCSYLLFSCLCCYFSLFYAEPLRPSLEILHARSPFLIVLNSIFLCPMSIVADCVVL